VTLALNHGHYHTRVAETVNDVITVFANWQPHLIVLDLDRWEQAPGRPLESTAGRTRPRHRAHVDEVTRGKLTAFERGVDDGLTVPFSPEEFVTRG
jgi:DNA-binding response OmpR family regulator